MVAYASTPEHLCMVPIFSTAGCGAILASTPHLSPCSFLLRILTHKRFHSNLAIAPTCDTVSTYHITDNARDPQRGLSRATYLLKVSRRAAEPNEEES